MEQPSRRRVVLACASGAIAAIAGCNTGPGDGADGTGTTSETSDDEATGTDTATDAATGESGTDTAAGESGTTAADGTAATTAGPGPQFGEAVAFPDSFAMSTTVSGEGEAIEMTGRFHGGDVYWEFTRDGRRTEWYLVGDESYVVTGGQCFRGAAQSGVSRDDADPGSFSEDAAANPALEPVGTESIDGAEVLVYEVPASGTSGGDGTLTYYVLADSGHPRRITSDSARWDFHSWGAVDPVVAPSGDCTAMPTGGFGGGG